VCLSSFLLIAHGFLPPEGGSHEYDRGHDPTNPDSRRDRGGHCSLSVPRDPEPRGGAGPPNILVILLDDLRSNATGYAVHPHVRTPQIDRIANGGVNFRNAFNYEKQFPYTPNVRGVRTADWKCVHYPHGDGGPDRHLAELYDLRKDADELKNLINDPASASELEKLKRELAELMAATGLTPENDRMPIDEGIKQELPDQKIR
jgi:arylsulfatase A-like enzyme